MKHLLLFGTCVLLSIPVLGQGCIAMDIGARDVTGYNCGTTVFVQDSVPLCSNSIDLPAACAIDTAKNPVWYAFSGLKDGELGFVITPKNPSDDYNWTLYEVRSPLLDTQKISSVIVGSNWSRKEGKTGASADGKKALVCRSPIPNPLHHPSPFSTMPHIQKGHLYRLMISHNSGVVQDGYTLSFNHGSDLIIDTSISHLKKAQVSCNGRTITVFLTHKKIKVTPHFYYEIGIRSSSLSSDGSDFKLLHTSVGIQSAYTNASKFSMPKFTLELDNRLTPGHYTLVMQKGSDRNTLLGNCPNKSIPVGTRLDFEVPYIPPTPMKRFIKSKCAAKSIQVIFNGKIKCNSIANDGSDFSIVNVNTGKHLTIAGAEGIHCEYNLTDTVQVYFAKPIGEKGTYHLSLKKGTDDNSILNECDVASKTDQILTFTDLGGVSAIINPNLQYECNKVKVNLSNPGKQGTEKWEWSSSSGETSHKPSFSFTDTSFKSQTIKLKVSNGNCSAKDSIQLSFNKDYYLHADFSLPSFVCPQDPVQIKNKSKGTHISQWNWSFGNGTYSHKEHPDIQHYPVTTFTKKYPIKLMITNSKGCRDTAIKKITISNTCDIYVPSAFTPDNDGKNDYLHPLNAFLAKDLSFKVYNRFGQLVFQTKDWTHGWDGTFHGKLQPEGSYIWILHFINSKTGKKVFRKGASLLIR